MVTIVGYKPIEKEDGTIFYMLQLRGDAEAVLSQTSHRWYLTARVCSITTTFDEPTCKQLVGTTLKGSVIKVETEEYEYTVPETGEVITLTHSWEYDPFNMMSQDNEKHHAQKEAVLG